MRCSWALTARQHPSVARQAVSGSSRPSFDFGLPSHAGDTSLWSRQALLALSSPLSVFSSPPSVWATPLSPLRWSDPLNVISIPLPNLLVVKARNLLQHFGLLPQTRKTHNFWPLASRMNPRFSCLCLHPIVCKFSSFQPSPLWSFTLSVADGWIWQYRTIWTRSLGTRNPPAYTPCLLCDSFVISALSYLRIASGYPCSVASNPQSSPVIQLNITPRPFRPPLQSLTNCSHAESEAVQQPPAKALSIPRISRLYSDQVLKQTPCCLNRRP